MEVTSIVVSVVSIDGIAQFRDCDDPYKKDSTTPPASSFKGSFEHCQCAYCIQRDFNTSSFSKAFSRNPGH